MITKNKNKSVKKNNSVFNIFNKFAKYYDEIYSDKDYERESNFILSCFKQYGIPFDSDILDLGCGTGGHSTILAKKNFKITGIDLSPTVLDIARKKFNSLQLSGDFIQANITDFDLNKKFSACISMFCSVCYLTDLKKFKKMLKNVNQHLKSNGLFIFDFWNGDAVLEIEPSTKVKFIENNQHRIIRIATPSMDYKNQTCSIEYHCLVIKKNSIIDEFKEYHKIRFHFIPTLKNLLEKSNFEILHIMPIENNFEFKNSDKLIKNWYLFVIARKK